MRAADCPQSIRTASGARAQPQGGGGKEGVGEEDERGPLGQRKARAPSGAIFHSHFNVV